MGDDRPFISSGFAITVTTGDPAPC